MSNYDDLLNNDPTGGQMISKDEYAAKKQAQREAVFALSDSTALDVAVDCERFCHYLDVQSQFDRYSTVNALLILAQNPEATRLGDFDHWKNLGGFVKPGQKGISILEPHEYTKEDGTPGIGYNVKKVFDISQIDTRKMKVTPVPNYTERQLLAALINKAPVKISGVDELHGDHGAMIDSDTHEIYVRKGMGFAKTFHSVAQEIALLDLATGPDAPSDPFFSSYCASYLLCKKFGVDTQNFNFVSAPTIFDTENAQAIKAELSLIRNAADNIAGRMVKQLEVANKTARHQDAR